MTQQPYYPPQPQQYAPPAPPQQVAAPPAYQPQYPGYPGQAPAQQAYPQAAPVQYAPQPAFQAPPAAQGSLDDFYNQPTSGSGPGISWTDKASQQKPIGAWYAGYIVRDVTNGDIQQQTNPQGVPQTFRDGRPKWQMKVPLKGITGYDGAVEFPEGEGTWYVRGQARDELTRAMAEAGVHGAPQAGAYVVIELVQRRPSGAGFQPANIVRVQYVPPAGAAQQNAAPAATEAASPAPVAPQPAQPVQQAPAPVAVPPVAPPVPQPQMAVAAPVPQQAPVPAPMAAAPAAAPIAPPQAAPVAAPQPPAELSQEQQELLARLTGAGVPAAAAV